MKLTARLLMGAVVAISLSNCGSGSPIKRITSPAPTTQTDELVVFDTGRGSGPYDSMTYAKYSSTLILTPQETMTLSSIRPQVWYCNGACGFLAFIRDEHYAYLGAEAGLVDGTGDASPKFLDRHLETPLTLSAGTQYLVEMEVWTTKSIGIYTTGDRTSGTIGSASYSVSASAPSARGAIAFEMVR